MTTIEIKYPESLVSKARKLRQSHVLVTGAHGFIGASLLNLLSLAEVPCRGLSSGQHTSDIRLTNDAKNKMVLCDLNNHGRVADQFTGITHVVHTATFGAYSWQKDSSEIFQQVTQLENLLKVSQKNQIKAFVHLGSSSEYGDECRQATESQPLKANSLYSLAKAQCHELISYYGQKQKLPTMTLRLFSIYGPGEDPRRLLPQICQSLLKMSPLTLAKPATARDFVHIFDVLEIILEALLNLTENDFGEAYNVCTGVQTTLKDIAEHLHQEHAFSDIQWKDEVAKSWDLSDWSGSPAKTEKRFSWRPQVAFADGLRLTLDFYRENPEFLNEALFSPRKKISIVAPCYMDLQSIPILFSRLADVFKNLNYTFEFIVIDDLSPDGAYEALKDLAFKDPRWVLAKHTRNFGSQAIFMHGMEIATGEAIVLMDGDLQDPPELIPAFIRHWEKGADLCLGQRVSREEGLLFNLKCKTFYRLWNLVSRVEIPLDCGDFGLISKGAAQQLLRTRSRIKLWRPLRAYPSYKTALIPYQRPCRAFGHSTNNNRKLLVWSLRFIFSTPNYVALIYTLSGLAGWLVFQGSSWFLGAWLVLGIGLLAALLNLVYLSRFNYPLYTTEELIKNQLLVRFPKDEHAPY